MKVEKPFALSLEEWEEWEFKTKAEHPVWWLFHEEIPCRWGRLCRRAKDAKWWVLHRFHPKHRYHIAKSGLPPGYHDPQDVILYTAFSQFERFYKHWGWAGKAKDYADAGVEPFKEMDGAKELWDYRFGFASTVEELHEYWTSRQDPYEVIDYKAEQELHNKDDEMLVKMMQIRQGLWN